DPSNPVIIDDADPNNPTVKDPTVLDNIGGVSVGVDGDGIKLGGTRIDLDQLCGKDNQRCLRTEGTNDLILDVNGRVQWNADAAGISLSAFLQTPQGMKMGGLTGGIQGIEGTLAGTAYSSGSWQDRLIEFFAGPHDYLGGQGVGLYDEQGNAVRNRPFMLKVAHNTWSVLAIPPAAPFAMAKGLPPGVWQAIITLVKESP
ncbi:hypothetical protein RZA67_16305, partial [Stenotrophomonas sp. C3(2023)]|uniref:hypothetical protein n=1 Tax=Stenotrophomonas sp. C3(2023) TaxID=3080277 RepID=UPI00293D0C90